MTVNFLYFCFTLYSGGLDKMINISQIAKQLGGTHICFRGEDNEIWCLVRIPKDKVDFRGFVKIETKDFAMIAVELKDEVQVSYFFRT